MPDADTYLECSGFALSGNVKLVKDGAGWLAMTRANQTFTGGVLIAEGTGSLAPQIFMQGGYNLGTETDDYFAAENDFRFITE